MNYNILEMKGGALIFECNVDGMDLEIRMNCEADENHEDGSGFDTVDMSCPTIGISEISVQRFVRDLKVQGLKTIRIYEERYKAW